MSNRAKRTNKIDAAVSSTNIEYVEWIDSGGINGWHLPEEAPRAMECLSIGWVTHESNDAINLTSHMQKVPRFHHADLTIPKCAITKRVRIA